MNSYITNLAAEISLAAAKIFYLIYPEFAQKPVRYQNEYGNSRLFTSEFRYNNIVREKIRRHNLRYALMCGVCLEIIKFQIIQKACQMWNW